MVQQHVLLGQQLENILVAEQFLRQSLGKQWIKKFLLVLNFADCRKAVQINGSVNEIHVMLGQPEVVQQKIPQVFRAFVTDFESNGRSMTARFQLTLKRKHQVTNFLVIDIQVAVASYTKLVAAVDTQTGEQFCDGGVTRMIEDRNT